MAHWSLRGARETKATHSRITAPGTGNVSTRGSASGTGDGGADRPVRTGRWGSAGDVARHGQGIVHREPLGGQSGAMGRDVAGMLTALARVLRNPTKQVRLTQFVRQASTDLAALHGATAHVVVCAKRKGQAIVMSDPDDLRRIDAGVVEAALFDRTAIRKAAFRLSDDTAATGVKAAYDGEHYWVVWRNGGETPVVRALRLSAQGDPVGEPLTVAEGAIGADAPAVAAVGPSLLLVGYNRFDPALGSMRAALRTIIW